LNLNFEFEKLRIDKPVGMTGLPIGITDLLIGMTDKSVPKPVDRQWLKSAEIGKSVDNTDR
jgi:hypothetical protein